MLWNKQAENVAKNKVKRDLDRQRLASLLALCDSSVPCSVPVAKSHQSAWSCSSNVWSQLTERVSFLPHLNQGRYHIWCEHKTMKCYTCTTWYFRKLLHRSSSSFILFGLRSRLYFWQSCHMLMIRNQCL